MANDLVKSGRITQPAVQVSKARQVMDRVLARIDPGSRSVARPRSQGRLIFGLDLTGSRQASLREARIATASMFESIKAFGAVAVKLIYYRGTMECQEGAWHDNPETVSRSMLQLSCESGKTQIRRLLNRVIAEEQKLSCAVFIGDHCEEDHFELKYLAGSLGRRSIPLYIFHECADHDERSLQAKPLFKQMAELSGGLYVEFKPDSGGVLHELLSSVAAFSAGGSNGLRQLALPKTSEAIQVHRRLMLGPGTSQKP
jgi:hypothetical protein